jgi:hypothetical protein
VLEELGRAVGRAEGTKVAEPQGPNRLTVKSKAPCRGLVPQTNVAMCMLCATTDFVRPDQCPCPAWPHVCAQVHP